jgi:hypothetical protein
VASMHLHFVSCLGPHSCGVCFSFQTIYIAVSCSLLVLVLMIQLLFGESIFQIYTFAAPNTVFSYKKYYSIARSRSSSSLRVRFRVGIVRFFWHQIGGKDEDLAKSKTF